MTLRETRRQQFLVENHFRIMHTALKESISYFDRNPVGSGVDEVHRLALARMSSANDRLILLTLHYTAGQPIEPLRDELEDVVAAYERYAEKQRAYENDPDAMAFPIGSFDGYCPYIGLIGLCYLLHRRDLLTRVAELVDGPGKSNAGIDWLIEEMLAFAPMERYTSEIFLAPKPFETLADAFSTEDNGESLKHLQRFLKRWYKALAAAPWHDTHKPDENGNQGGYYGYWSFEAGAAVILLGIADDSSLHQYLYYPKDLVAWSRSFRPDDESVLNPAISRIEAGKPCPRSGWWMTPAKAGSRRYFEQGTIMPSFGSNYGLIIWQWDVDQSTPKL